MIPENFMMISDRQTDTQTDNAEINTTLAKMKADNAENSLDIE